MKAIIILNILFSQKAMSYNFNKEGKRMLNLAKELYPFNRSLMGPDIRYSMQKFINLNSDFKEIKFFTGEKV